MRYAFVYFNKLTQLGSDVNLVESSPVIPLHNIYFRQLLPLIDIKLRLGRALARQTAPTDNVPTKWQTAVRELELGLELARTAACLRKPVEAQLLFALGKMLFLRILEASVKLKLFKRKFN